MLKRIIALLLIIAFSFQLVFVKNVYAQDETVWYSQDFHSFVGQTFNPDNEDEIFGERYTLAQVEWIFYSLIAQPLSRIVGGPEMFHCLFTSGGVELWTDCIVPHFIPFLHLSYDTSQPEPIADTSFSGIITGYLNNKSSLSGVRYVILKVKNNKLSPVKEAYAQGFGYGAISDVIQTLWTFTRNVAYFFLILAMIVLAFMIMFRTKSSPQTAVTVQSSIPKVIFALIFITFSYAIAGFMIDLTYVVIGIVATIFSNSGSGLIQEDWGVVFNFLTVGPFGTGSIGLFMYYILMFSIGSVWTITRLFIPTLSLNPSELAGYLPGVFVGFITAILWPIIAFFIFIALLIASFKTMFMLFKTFVNIILSIIVSPLVIVLGILYPGMGVTSFMKTLASNLAVYPVVGVLYIVSFMFLLSASGVVGNFFMDITSQIIGVFPNSNIPNWQVTMFNASSDWTPPLTVGGANLVPLLYLFASIATMLMIPKTAEMVKSAIAGKPFAYGSAIGEGLGPLAVGAAAGWGLARGGGQAAWNTWAPKSFQSWDNLMGALQSRMASRGGIPGRSGGGGRSSGGATQG